MDFSIYVDNIKNQFLEYKNIVEENENNAIRSLKKK